MSEHAMNVTSEIETHFTSLKFFLGKMHNIPMELSQYNLAFLTSRSLF